MSSKINILNIVKGHFDTLRSSSTGKVSIYDYFTFILLPLAVSAFIVWFGFEQSDQMSSLLVNFGAIFTALLLSVLVLVYDQGNKLADKMENNNDKPIFNQIKTLLDHLYYNICYSIVVSVSLVFLCLIEKVLRDCHFDISVKDINVNIQLDNYLLSPLIIFLTMNLMLTILMIVKRMHTLLTAK
ncbi:hypothetical protein [Shewanella algae]|uniref:hypothetical protein n=1 Tax=Shewanella algae TaxID=38313 RepID=UPI0006D193D7|nr:hypothetical protein [Shewanella algae]MDO8253170.1 hypothetical protein [Shewanella algae]